jgi:microcystin-dependent protein
MFAGNFAPLYWAFCNGQLLPIAENEVLFQLIGTTYGGDGQNTFALPNLQSRFPVHQGNGYVIGQTGGSETVTLTVAQIPAHSHVPQANGGQGTASSPAGNVWAQSALNNYSATAPSSALDPGALGSSGGSQPHDNLPPYLAVSFIIALEGIFPSQN